MDSRIVGIHRCRESRIDDTTVTHLDINNTGQAVVDRQCRIHQTSEQIAACGTHNRRADVGWPLGLIRATGEVEEQTVILLFDFDMKPDRLVEIDTVAIDETFTFTKTIGPGSNLRANLRFGERE